VFDLPFLFKDAETAYRVLDGPIGQEQLDALEGSGFIGLCYWENGWRHVSNSKREITTLEDLKGLKIRTMESPIHVDTWKALGTNPTPMSFSQLYTALEQKVVDGQENPLANVVSNKLDEVQKFITLDGHLYGASPFMVSKVFWDTLSDEEKAAVKKAAIMARDDERKMAQEEDKVSIETLTKNGVKISELAPGEKDKIKAALQVIYDKYKGQFGETLMTKVLEATK
jgi:tripartite ATP-independent transporter DctP family solute receptor